MSMTPTTTPPHLGPGVSAEPSPAVVHVRRPRSAATDDVAIDTPHTISVDDVDLPPVVLRLPNLAAVAKGLPAVSIASIAHWTFLALGGLLALWLIFGGRAKPMPAVDEAPAFTQPVRAEASSTPAWNPPPLESAGDSVAPSWTPPAAAAPASGVVPAPAAAQGPSLEPAQSPSPAAEASQPESGAAPGSTPSQNGPSHGGGSSGGESSIAQGQPAHEVWPKAEVSVSPAPNSVAPTMPYPGTAPAVAGPGPELRTAQREPAPATSVAPARASSELPAGDAEPLEITVPVPQ